jgi:anti-sigma factor RsiW
MLRPALVALAYDEPHPEKGMLSRHLRRCPSCRRELAELKAVRGCVETLLAPRSGRRSLPMGSVPDVAWRVVPGLAAAVLAAALFLGGWEDPGAPGSVRLEPGLPAAMAFGGEDVDRHLEWVEMDIRALETLGGEPW